MDKQMAVLIGQILMGNNTVTDLAKELMQTDIGFSVAMIMSLFLNIGLIWQFRRQYRDISAYFLRTKYQTVNLLVSFCKKNRVQK